MATNSHRARATAFAIAGLLGLGTAVPPFTAGVGHADETVIITSATERPQEGGGDGFIPDPGKWPGPGNGNPGTDPTSPPGGGGPSTDPTTPPGNPNPSPGLPDPSQPGDPGLPNPGQPDPGNPGNPGNPDPGNPWPGNPNPGNPGGGGGGGGVPDWGSIDWGSIDWAGLLRGIMALIEQLFNLFR